MAVKQPWQDNYQPQSGEYGDGYCGDLNKGTERQTYEKRDADVDATRKEFARPKASKVPGGDD
jgi:hypothetical protein